MNFQRELKKRKRLVPIIIEKYQNMGNPIPDTIIKHAGKMAFLPTHLASASSIDYSFMGEAKRRGLLPVWISFSEDTFRSVNKRKKMYLHTFDAFGYVEKLTNPNKWEGKKLSEIILDSRENLVQYHFEKWQKIPGEKMHCDMSQWLQFFGKAGDYYYHLEVLNTFFGVGFWPANLPLYNKGEKEPLVENVMNPAKKRVFDEFGFKPICHSFDLKPFLI